MELFQTISPSEFFQKFLAEGVRPDGRSFNSIRKTSLTVGSISSCVGSALARIGNTAILCGIKAEVGPLPSKEILAENFQFIAINFELPALCGAPNVRPGKPTEQAYVIAETLRSIFRGSRILDTSSFSIPNANSSGSPSNYSWYLYADIYCLNHDGNLLDTALLALMSALRNVRLPKAVFRPIGLESSKMELDDEEDMEEDNEESRDVPGRIELVESAAKDEGQNIRVLRFPISLTSGVVSAPEEGVSSKTDSDSSSSSSSSSPFLILVDPTLNEEELMQASVSVVIDSKSSNYQLNMIRKAGGVPTTPELLKSCCKTATKRAKELASLVDQAVERERKKRENSAAIQPSKQK